MQEPTASVPQVNTSIPRHATLASRTQIRSLIVAFLSSSFPPVSRVVFVTFIDLYVLLICAVFITVILMFPKSIVSYFSSSLSLLFASWECLLGSGGGTATVSDGASKRKLEVVTASLISGRTKGSSCGHMAAIATA
ncbi:hypothetical protein NL676_030368 [Syzygium grande]|nr:hypothetical protein NL676_030368 [Syzygium grande]